jgi:drug/metabolite transporter (DMT)-like permease
LTYSGAMVNRLGAMRLVGMASTAAAVLCIGQYFVLRPLDTAFAAPPAALGLSLLNATICTVAPVLMVMMGIERLGAPLAAQTGMVGPMSTGVMAAVFLGEPFTASVAAGTARVVAGVWLITRLSRTT